MSLSPMLIIHEEQSFMIGQDTFIDSTIENGNAVVFEDNEETGYFYAISKNDKLTILDALHIYNVEDVLDKEKTSIIQILWTKDMTKAVLAINNYYHAIFDFNAKGGYCRHGFPLANNHWNLVEERILTDQLLGELIL